MLVYAVVSAKPEKAVETFVPVGRRGVPRGRAPGRRGARRTAGKVETIELDA